MVLNFEIKDLNNLKFLSVVTVDRTFLIHFSPHFFPLEPNLRMRIQTSGCVTKFPGDPSLSYATIFGATLTASNSNCLTKSMDGALSDAFLACHHRVNTQ